MLVFDVRFHESPEFAFLALLEPNHIEQGCPNFNVFFNVVAIFYQFDSHTV